MSAVVASVLIIIAYVASVWVISKEVSSATAGLAEDTSTVGATKEFTLLPVMSSSTISGGITLSVVVST